MFMLKIQQKSKKLEEGDKLKNNEKENNKIKKKDIRIRKGMKRTLKEDIE